MGMTLGAIEIAAAIKARQITNEAAAALLGLAPKSGQITRLCSGQQKPGRKLAFEIERVLGVSMSSWEREVVEPKRPAAKVA